MEGSNIAKAFLSVAVAFILAGIVANAIYTTYENKQDGTANKTITIDTIVVHDTVYIDTTKNDVIINISVLQDTIINIDGTPKRWYHIIF